MADERCDTDIDSSVNMMGGLLRAAIPFDVAKRGFDWLKTLATQAELDAARDRIAGAADSFIEHLCDDSDHPEWPAFCRAQPPELIAMVFDRQLSLGAVLRSPAIEPRLCASGQSYARHWLIEQWRGVRERERKQNTKENQTGA